MSDMFKEITACCLVWYCGEVWEDWGEWGLEEFGVSGED